MKDKFQSVADVERYAARHGVTLTDAERQEIRAAAAITESAERGGLVARWNAFYPAFLAAIVSLGDVLVTFAKTVFASVGMPAILVLLLIVEYHRVKAGIALFEGSIAGMASVSVVLANLTLEFAIHHTELSAGYTRKSKTRFSLRTFAGDIAYMLGLSKEWQERELSPAWRFIAISRTLTFAILVLALLGSMFGTISEYDGVVWYVAIEGILTRSDLSELTIWLGGLLFTYVTVRLAQVVSAHLAFRAAETLHTMTTKADARTAAEIERALAIVAGKIATKNGSHAGHVHPVTPDAAAITGNGHADTMTPDAVTANGHAANFPTPHAPNGNGNGSR